MIRIVYPTTLDPIADRIGHLFCIVKMSVTIRMTILRGMSQLSIFISVRDFYCLEKKKSFNIFL